MLPGVSTNNSNYQPQQQISNSEVQQSSSNISNNNIYNNSTTSSNTNYSTGAKSTTSITRPLQNVSLLFISIYGFCLFDKTG